MENFRFQSTWALLLLLLALPVIWRIWKSSLGKSKREGGIRYSSLMPIKALEIPHAMNARSLLALFRTVAMICFILALARPQTGKALSEVKTEVVDINLVLDTSGSMDALDFFMKGKRVTRLQAVKKVVAEFIQNRPGDRIGMVVFGEEAFTQSPQTLDHGVLLSFLDEVKRGMAGDRTAIGLAIGIAVKRLKDLPGKSKVIILLTDGSNNVPILSPEKASQIAKSFGIKIYTIGVGTKGKAPFLVEGIFGQRLVYQKVDMDEDTLKKIARITGGRYYRATDSESLKKIYTEIDQLEKTEIKRREYVEYKEHYASISFVGLGFLLSEIFLGHTFFRKLP